MQINISDHDVKTHTRILKRLQLLLIVALGIAIGTLYSAGAFSTSSKDDAGTLIAASNAEPDSGEMESVDADAAVEHETEVNSSPVRDEDEQEAENAKDTSSTLSMPPDAETAGDAYGSVDVTTLPVAKLPNPDRETFSDDQRLQSVPPAHELLADKDTEVVAPALLPKKLRDKANDAFLGYLRLRARWRIDGEQIAKVATQIAALGSGSTDSKLNPLEDTVTLETSQSNDGSEPTENADESESLATDSIVIRNGDFNRGRVAFLVGREVKQLEPGASLVVAGDEAPVVVRFHRGGEFGNATMTLSVGVYEFEATAKGWYLETVDDE